MQLKHNQAFTLFEVMITVAITTIGLLGISTLQLQSSRATQDSGSKSLALSMIEDIENRMALNKSSLASYATAAVNCASPPTICEAANQGNGTVNAANCTAAQVAAYDLWSVGCPSNYTVAGATTWARPADYLANPTMAIQINAANERATVTVTWSTRSSGQSGGADVYTASSDSVTLTSSLTREVQL